MIFYKWNTQLLNRLYLKHLHYYVSTTIAGHESLRIRINQSVPSLSRRACEKAIKEGRVTVNGKCLSTSDLSLHITPYDVIHFDGIKQNPAFRLNGSPIGNDKNYTILPDKQTSGRTHAVTTTHTYIKMYKTANVTCTTDTSTQDNIIDFGEFEENGVTNRLFPVGRLDKHTSGLILLTSDGQFMHSVLGAQSNVSKIYEVTTQKDLSEQDIKCLTQGVEITTSTTSKKLITAPTLPCKVTRVKSNQVRSLRSCAIEITEGRNRQIRKMIGAVNNRVVTLVRISFAGITLGHLKPGEWCHLSKKELLLLKSYIEKK